MTLFRRFSEADLRQAEEHVARAIELIAVQRQRIARIEAEGGDASFAKETLGTMERIQSELVEHRDQVARAVAELT
jgi:hypothetical protein